MSMQQAPMKNPTLCATIVFNNRKPNKVRNTKGEWKPETEKEPQSAFQLIW